MRNSKPNTNGINFTSQKICIGCGEEFTSHTLTGKWCNQKCRSYHHHRVTELNPHWRLKRLCHMARNRATSKNIDFDIDADYMFELWNKQEGKCAISGIELDLVKSTQFSVNPYGPSIDRIIPSKGYTRGNVRIVCYQVNVALSEYGEEQLLRMCRAITSMPVKINSRSI